MIKDETLLDRIDKTIEYFREEYAEKSQVWEEPMDCYSGGITPNDLMAIRYLLESGRGMPCYLIVVFDGDVAPEQWVDAATTNSDEANRLFNEASMHTVGGSVELQRWEGRDKTIIRKKTTKEIDDII